MLATVIMLITAACANIGSPEGGPRDYSHPVMVRCKPAPGTLNFKGNKVEITFDENVNLKDQHKRVIISPASTEPPVIKCLGKKIVVEFRDTLRANTTYVLDFSDAVEDNNEGNVLDDFAVAFSTGDELDSLRISGMVLRAADLEPMQHMLVGIHSNLDDSAFTKLPFYRVTRTNDRGEFTLKGLKAGRYRIYALNDVDGNYTYVRTEDCAWLDEIIVPSTSTYASSDTTFTFDHRVDTVKAATHIEYLPNNLLLSMFNEQYYSLYMRQSSRPADNRIQLLFSGPSPDLPRLTVLRPTPARADWFSLEQRSSRDSLVYWLTDSTLIKSDSLLVKVEHLMTDSLERLSWKQDTLNFVFHKSNAQLKQEADEAKEHQKRLKDMEKLRQRREKLVAEGKPTDEVDDELHLLHLADSVKPPVIKLEMNKPPMGIDDSLFVKAPTPILSIDPTLVHLQQFNATDSLWHDLTIPAMQRADSTTLQRWVLPITLNGGEQYRFTLDKGAITSIYHIPNDSTTLELKVRAEDDYANLFFDIKGLNGQQAFVELLDGSDKPIRHIPVDAGGKVTILHVDAGTYYARLILDRNNNGKWDTGNYTEHRQPEDVFYYPGKLKLRKNWDVEQTWDLYATAVNLQKSDDIKRNKPENRMGPLERKDSSKKKKNGTDDEEEEEFGTGFGGRRQGTYSGDKYRDATGM